MKKLVAFILVLLAILSAIVAIFYFTKTAGNLPHFFLGYSKNATYKHNTHGIAFSVLAIVLLIGAWMVSGRSEDNSVVDTHQDTDD
jgi:hypothetical protein